jgi:uncharacterized protein (DUF2267 family)
MSAHFEHAVQRASVWLADVTAALGTPDRHYGLRVLRAWLHTMRDRLTVDAAAKFGQQLPELLRGTYYDGWEPNRVPQKYDASEYVQRFSAEAVVPASEVPGMAAAVTHVIAEHMSTGQVDQTLAELPADLRATIRDGATVTGRVGAGGAEPAGTGGRHRPESSIDERISALTEAVRALARGLEGPHPAGQGVDAAQVARAARIADEILVASGR